MCRQGLSTTTLLALSTASWKWNGTTLASQVGQLLISEYSNPFLKSEAVNALKFSIPAEYST